ncbi:MAG: hypothetical protein SV422_09415 [Pseudomonadota bacterium]|nr:hypothetical protein [Pseudomonadota bacterium]
MDNDSKLIELEGKLFAHRRLIQILIEQLAAQHKMPEQFWALLDESRIVQDHQEDPGVVQPDLAFAYNSITEFEYTRLVEDAKAARDAT